MVFKICLLFPELSPFPPRSALLVNLGTSFSRHWFSTNSWYLFFAPSHFDDCGSWQVFLLWLCLIGFPKRPLPWEGSLWRGHPSKEVWEADRLGTPPQLPKWRGLDSLSEDLHESPPGKGVFPSSLSFVHGFWNFLEILLVISLPGPPIAWEIPLSHTCTHTQTHTHTHTGYFTFLWFWGVFWYKLSQYFI